jgi:hypothetical protein
VSYAYNLNVGGSNPHFGLLKLSGWWFGTLNIFPYIGNNHPN